MLQIVVYVILAILIAVVLTIAAITTFEVCGPLPALLLILMLFASAVLSRRSR